MVTRTTPMLPQIIRWLPRILLVLFAAFLSLFALDIFSEGYSILDTIVGLFMHLIPTFLLLIVLAIAWKFPLVGGVLFILLGAVSIFFFDTYEHWISFVLISIPPFVIGVLFLLDGWYRRHKLTVG